MNEQQDLGHIIQDFPWMCYLL